MDTCPHINLTSDAVWDPNGSFMEAREHQLTSRIHAVSVNGDDIWETMSLTDLDAKAISELDNDIVIEEIATDADIFASPEHAYYPKLQFPNPAELMDEDDVADRLIESVTRFSNTRWDEATKDFTDEPMPTTESDPTVVISALTTKDRLDAITPELLAKRWGIGVELAQRTLKVTTLRGVRNYDTSLSKRYDTRLPHLVYPIMKGKRFYTDTLFAGTKSIRMNQCAQVWSDGNGLSI